MDDQLATALDQLQGFNKHLDGIAAHLEALHTLASSPTLTRDQRQALTARLAGGYDDDLITAVALVAKALCTIPADAAEPIGDDDRKQAEQHGQDIALLLTQPHLHQPAAEAAYCIDPATNPPERPPTVRNILARLRALCPYAGQCSACGGTFEGWNGGICDACQAAGRS